MDNKVLNTVLTVVAFAIGIIGLIMGVMVMLGNESMVGPSITLAIVVMAVAAAVAVIFGVFHFLGNIKRNIPMLIGVVVFAVLAVVCYNLASSDVLKSYEEGITASAVKFSGAGLMVMYVLVVAAVAAALIGEASRIFK